MWRCMGLFVVLSFGKIKPRNMVYDKSRSGCSDYLEVSLVSSPGSIS
jgi:hypothetical protein